MRAGILTSVTLYQLGDPLLGAALPAQNHERQFELSTGWPHGGFRQVPSAIHR